MSRTLLLASALVLTVGLVTAPSSRSEPPAPRADVRPQAVSDRPRPPAPVLLSVEVIPDPPAAPVARPDPMQVGPRATHVAADGRPLAH